MPKTILGLDIGRQNIKAVLFTRKGLAGGRILDARILDIHASGGIEAALQKLAEDKQYTEASCRLVLPPADIMFRQVNLPFRDDSRIKKTLPFELEPLIPFSVEDVVADYLKIPHDGLLVAAHTKTAISDWITRVEGTLCKAPVIDVSTASLASQLLADKPQGACGLILDIGATSTAAVFYEEGAMVQIRSLTFGGTHITEALAQDLNTGIPEVEQKKIRADYPAECARVEALCRRFCSELKNTVEYMTLNGSLKKGPDQITLTGGGALFVLLQKELENAFSLTPELPDLLKMKGIETENGVRLQPQIMNAAVAAALRSTSGRKSFNLRQGEFTTQSIGLNLKGQLRWAGVIAGILLILAVANQALDYTLKTHRLNSIKKQIAMIFKKNFPEAGSMVDPVQQLRTKLAENQKAFGFYKGDSETTVLNIVKEISGRITPSLDVTVHTLGFENGVVLMKGEAKNVDDVSAIKTQLMESPYFKEVTMGSTSLTREGGNVNFDLRIEVK